MAKLTGNKTKLFSFNLNGDEWTVFLVDCISDDVSIFGQTRFCDGEILLLKNIPENTIRKTFIHEFTHAWLFETGHCQDGPYDKYNCEDLCSIFSQEYGILENTLILYDNAIKSIKKEKN